MKTENGIKTESKNLCFPLLEMIRQVKENGEKIEAETGKSFTLVCAVMISNDKEGEEQDTNGAVILSGKGKDVHGLAFKIVEDLESEVVGKVKKATGGNDLMAALFMKAMGM